MGEIRGWGNLQETVRRHLVRACSQHVPPNSVNLDEILELPELAPIRDEIVPGLPGTFVYPIGTWRQEDLQQHDRLLLPRHGADVERASAGLRFTFGGLFRHRRFRALWRLCAGHRMVRKTGNGCRI